MGRLLACILLLLTVWGLAACPQPIARDAAATPPEGSSQRTARDTFGRGAAPEDTAAGIGEPDGAKLKLADEKLAAGSREAGADQPAEPASSEAVGPQPEQRSVASESKGGQENTPDLVGPQPPAPAEPPPAKAPAPGPSREPEPAPVGPSPPNAPAPLYGALDAENFTGDAPRETAWGQPPSALSKDALAFAGRWQVLVLNRQGEAQLLGDADSWVISLERDGQFFAKQMSGAQEWRQSGRWSLTGAKLLLQSGPGGDRSYEISQELPDICVWRDASRSTALFCVRQSEAAQAPAVQAKYDSDFGALSLRPSGPGHWRCAYGEPEGTLLLAQVGGYLAGTWEQAPSRGFAILELREGGFAGAWWYAESIAFDGRWLGVAEK